MLLLLEKQAEREGLYKDVLCEGYYGKVPVSYNTPLQEKVYETLEKLEISFERVRHG